MTRIRFVLLALISIPAIAGCPITIKCEYHNVYGVSKSGTEFRNGKQFAIYKHTYFEQGKNRECKLIVECD